MSQMLNIFFMLIQQRLCDYITQITITILVWFIYKRLYYIFYQRRRYLNLSLYIRRALLKILFIFFVVLTLSFSYSSKLTRFNICIFFFCKITRLIWMIINKAAILRRQCTFNTLSHKIYIFKNFDKKHFNELLKNFKNENLNA